MTASLLDSPTPATQDITIRSDPSPQFVSNISIRKVLDTVAAKYGISYVEMTGKCRTASYVRPRQISQYLAIRLTGKSTTMIGRVFQRDHTTVLHSKWRIEELLKSDPKLGKEIQTLQEELLGGVQ